MNDEERQRRSDESKIFFLDESLTQQHFKDECDLNVIMKRFGRVSDTAFLDYLNSFPKGRYGDFGDLPDYRTALDVVRSTEAEFEALPNDFKKQFDFNVERYLDYVSNLKQQEAVQKPQQVDKPVEGSSPKAAAG